MSRTFPPFVTPFVVPLPRTPAAPRPAYTPALPAEPLSEVEGRIRAALRREHDAFVPELIHRPTDDAIRRGEDLDRRLKARGMWWLDRAGSLARTMRAYASRYERRMCVAPGGCFTQNVHPGIQGGPSYSPLLRIPEGRVVFVLSEPPVPGHERFAMVIHGGDPKRYWTPSSTLARM